MIRDLKSHVNENWHRAQPVFPQLELSMTQRTGGENQCNLRMLGAVRRCFLYCQPELPLFCTVYRIFTLPCLLHCFVFPAIPPALCCFSPGLSLPSFNIQCQLRTRISASHCSSNSKKDRHILCLQRVNTCLLCLYSWSLFVFYDFFHFNCWQFWFYCYHQSTTKPFLCWVKQAIMFYSNRMLKWGISLLNFYWSPKGKKGDNLCEVWKWVADPSKHDFQRNSLRASL